MTEKDQSTQIPASYFPCSIACDFYPVLLVLSFLATKKNAIFLSQGDSLCLENITLVDIQGSYLSGQGYLVQHWEFGIPSYSLPI